jgi:hypothetical protein
MSGKCQPKNSRHNQDKVTTMDYLLDGDAAVRVHHAYSHVLMDRTTVDRFGLVWFGFGFGCTGFELWASYVLGTKV